MENQEKKIREIIAGYDGFVVAGHSNPDGDAIGSCLAMALALTKAGKRACVALEPFNEKFQVIPGGHLLAKNLDELSPSVMMVLDCGSPDRLGAAEPLLKKAQTTVCIDHHITHREFADCTYLDPNASSTCEMVYRALSPMGLIDKEVASALYGGILTDTGGFRFESAGPGTFRVVADLLSFGIPSTRIYNELLMSQSLSEARLMGFAASHLETFDGARIAACKISLSDMDNSGATPQDTSGIVGYLLNIRNVAASILVYEKEQGAIKASFRSTGMDVGKLAASLGGGGHKQAAGATLAGPLDSAYEKAVNLVRAEYAEFARSI
jgi:phosphoesterase RecJ-like protein